jgi:hypothetical protein
MQDEMLDAALNAIEIEIEIDGLVTPPVGSVCHRFRSWNVVQASRWTRSNKGCGANSRSP